MLLAAAVPLISCRQSGADVPDMLPFVSLTVSDTTSVEHGIIARYDDSDRYGTIAVAGPMDNASVLVGYLMACDLFDNVDGKMRPDGLPDFAGETFAPYYDIASLSYYDYYKNATEEDLKESVVRCAVASVSSNCHQSAYSREATVPKVPSKMFVLSSSLAAPSEADIDMLFSRMGKELPVISTVGALVSIAASGYGADSRIGLWAGSDVLASGVYASAFHVLSDENGGQTVDYVGFSPSDSLSAGESFLQFLDMYISSGDVRPLSMILIDDFLMPGDLKVLNGLLEEIKTSDEPEMLRYRHAVAGQCKVTGALEAVAMSCYKYLREHNEFTHRIAYPQKIEYMAVPSPDRNGEVKYIEMNNLYVP